MTKFVKNRPLAKDALDRIVALHMEIMRLFKRKMGVQDQEQGVNMLQLHALMMIREREGMTMKELADALHVTSPSATSFVQRLVRLKWLERRHDRRNRRVVRLRVTPRGQSMLTRMMRDRQRAMRGTFALLSVADRKAYIRILLHLISALQSR